MVRNATDVQRILSKKDEEFRNWTEEHHRHEDRLAELQRKATLSAEEEVEEKRLKKRKLFLKDQMAAKIRGFSSAGSAAS